MALARRQVIEIIKRKMCCLTTSPYGLGSLCMATYRGSLILARTRARERKVGAMLVRSRVEIVGQSMSHHA